MGLNNQQKGNNIEVAFQPVPLADIMASVKVVHNEPDQVPSKEANQEPHPMFGPHSNTQVAEFDFKKEVEHIPFKHNMGDIPLDKEH